MDTVSLELSASKVRPSRLIAEALVLRHGCAEVKQRAQAMGLNEHLTHAVISVCCRKAASGEYQPLVDTQQ